MLRLLENIPTVASTLWHVYIRIACRILKLADFRAEK